jgi:hypothetical protein
MKALATSPFGPFSRHPVLSFVPSNAAFAFYTTGTAWAFRKIGVYCDYDILQGNNVSNIMQFASKITCPNTICSSILIVSWLT